MKEYTTPLLEVLELTEDALCFTFGSEPTVEDNDDGFIEAE